MVGGGEGGVGFQGSGLSALLVFLASQASIECKGVLNEMVSLSCLKPVTNCHMRT